MPPRTIVLDETAARLIASLSTVVVSNLMAVLHNRGVISRDEGH